MDFLIWDLENKALLVFQIAISKLNDRKNVDDFTKESDGPSLKSKWTNLCGINEDNVYFIWIANDSMYF